jgi:hypothetical protein
MPWIGNHAGSGCTIEFRGKGKSNGRHGCQSRGGRKYFCSCRVGPGSFTPSPSTGRVEDWRASLGRCLYYWDRSRARPAVGRGCSVPALSICKTGSQSHHGLRFPKPPYNHTTSTVPRFQSPPRRNTACGFPALRAPICFTSRLMGLITLGQLSVRSAALDSR